MNILVLTTGGTIGALPYASPTHPPAVSSMPENGDDLVREALPRCFAERRTRCISLPPRDSKLIDDSYRANILRIIEEADEVAVLITHGTDTILQSADFLHERMVGRNDVAGRRIILTGSMIPLSNGIESDGHANLSFSLACLEAPPSDMTCVNVVLCDFDKSGQWRPRLYPIGGRAWTKFYDEDGRYNRIVSA